ncbi:MAG: response regulator transcription factor [Chloroflexi bacterium]|nr:response regulator transcription factor [Chloroflexota bacterium]MBU1750783.1 response regulator transcription factor [Chloroflexota bacterium]
MSYILVVEDECELNFLIVCCLRAAGYEARGVQDGRRALDQICQELPLGMVLDVMMPGLSGLDVCRQVRQDEALRHLPILMLSARGQRTDRIAGLEAGADDYMTKPFHVDELVGRVRTLLRRAASGAESTLIQAGALALDPQRHVLYIGQHSVYLTPTESSIMACLMTHAGEALTSHDVLSRALGYPPDSGDPTLVRTHVKNLRQKIEPDPAHPRYLVHQAGRGYAIMT